ncbi:MAG: 30S ribosomal protein S20 [bacterium]|nr:MAG: 30S ribosomal protein S20 [bacterium]
MPVTKTAKRALRGSKRKEIVNKITLSGLEIAVKKAKKSKDLKSIQKATSLTDRAAKENTIHKNKAGRIKSQLAKLMPAKLQTLSKKNK